MLIFRIHVALIAFALLSNVAFSQSHSYLPTSDAIWRMQYGSQDCFWQNIYAKYQYTIEGDTTINSKTYHKLHRSGNFICTPWPYFNPLSGLVGYFRNDTIARKVYFLPRDSITEQVLYDFNLKVGDTLKGYLVNYSGNYEAVVDSIDSILVDSTYRLRWAYKSPYPYWDGHIIEGIGCEFGLLEGLATGMDNTFNLNCHSVNTRTLYPSVENKACELYTAIEELPTLERSEVKVFPNPSISQIQISAPFKIQAITIFTMSGSLVLSVDSYGGKSIDVSVLSKGVYVVSIEDTFNHHHREILLHN